MEITKAAIYTLQLYYRLVSTHISLHHGTGRLTTSGGVGLSSGALAKPPMMIDGPETLQRLVEAVDAAMQLCDADPKPGVSTSSYANSKLGNPVVQLASPQFLAAGAEGKGMASEQVVWH
jgi:ABC-type nitrate/sulfonate/bicarbonate transport system substrate-binding protein